MRRTAGPCASLGKVCLQLLLFLTSTKNVNMTIPMRTRIGTMDTPTAIPSTPPSPPPLPVVGGGVGETNVVL